MKTSSLKKRAASLILILAVALSMCFGTAGTAFAGDQMNRVNFKVSVDGKEPVTVKGYNASYTYHTYVSLRDLASALSGSQKNMNVEYDAEKMRSVSLLIRTMYRLEEKIRLLTRNIRMIWFQTISVLKFRN